MRMVSIIVERDVQDVAEITDIAPDWSYIIDVIGPDNGIYCTNKAFQDYPDTKGAGTYVPGLEHMFGHGRKYQYACDEVHCRNERKCWVHT